MTFERIPNPSVAGELLIAVQDGVVCATCRQFAVPDKYYGSKCGCSPVLPPMTKAHLDNIEAARAAWEASDRAVPFPDYWAGWQAASVLIEQRSARLSEQVDIVEIDDVSYVDLGDCALIMSELAESKLREAALAGQLNAALQPTLDGEAFKKLRKENERLADALLYVADNCSDQEIASYAGNVLNGGYT